MADISHTSRRPSAAEEFRGWPVAANLPGVAFGALALLLFHFYKSFLKLNESYPSAAPIFLVAVLIFCIASTHISYAHVPAYLATLMRGMAIACGLYNFFLFPAIPAIAHTFGGTSQLILDCAWALAAISACLACWRPSWLVLCGFYVFWVKHLAGYLTGMPFHTMLDVLPLVQMPAFAAIALVALELLLRAPTPLLVRTATALRQSLVSPYAAIAFITIALQAANYFYSAVAKSSLDGGIFDWALNNHNQNIFFVALYNQQLPWGDWKAATSLAAELLHWVGRPLAIGILLVQFGTLLAFFRRSSFLILFTLLDIMHLGIFVLSGANFWTWFMINMSIIAAVAALPKTAFSWKTGMAGAALVAAMPAFADVARLGWYDSLAVNSTYLTAVQADGKETRVPATAFGFYSYPLAHMSFGLPSGSYLPTGTNGGTYFSAIYHQSYRCEFKTDHSPYQSIWDGPAFSQLVAGYHRQMLGKVDGDGHWSNDLYPHHFWTTRSLARQFGQLDLRTVTAYKLVTDSVCLDPITGSVKYKRYHNESRIALDR